MSASLLNVMFANSAANEENPCDFDPVQLINSGLHFLDSAALRNLVPLVGPTCESPRFWGNFSTNPDGSLLASCIFAPKKPRQEVEDLRFAYPPRVSKDMPRDQNEAGGATNSPFLVSRPKKDRRFVLHATCIGTSGVRPLSIAIQPGQFPDLIGITDGPCRLRVASD
jgi:hypothetical protein